jgi:aspartyl-tRNA(Asn)/glutamyl-tRNA(Gln) amidotransferase subunit A
MIGPFSSIKQIGTALRKRDVSSVELTELFLSRLETLGREHNAVAEVTREPAMSQAKVADASEPTGPLHGIPFGVKDLLATKGIPTRWGSPGHVDQVFDYDASVVTRLQDAGGVLVSKLEMIELAGGGSYNQADASRMGPCLSAWDKSLWAGGSSSGSGAATALGCVPYSIGTETSGSIVCPSAFNGCTGFRPTYGRVSRYGSMALCWSLDKIGPMARSVEDAAIVLKAIAGHDPKDATTLRQPLKLSPRGPKPRIGLLKETFQENDAPEAEAAYHNVIETLRKFGYEFVDIELPVMPYGLAVSLIVDAEGASAHEQFLRSDRLKLLQDPHQVAGFTAALETKAVDYLWAMRLRSEALKTNAIWDTCDCFFIPAYYHRAVSASMTFERSWFKMGDRDEPSNLLGWPAVAFPVGFEKGSPLGGQIIAPCFREDVCYRVVRDFQRNSDVHLKHPNC